MSIKTKVTGAAVKCRERAIEWWVSLTTKERKRYVQALSIVGIVIIGFGVYEIKNASTGERVVRTPPEKADAIVPGNLIDRDIDARIEEAVKAALKEQREAKTPESDLDSELDALEDLSKGEIEPNDYSGLDDLAFSPPPAPAASYPPPAHINAGMPEETSAPSFIGGIDNAQVYTRPPEPRKAKGKREVIIPPGFMPGFLLIGVHAQISSAGSGSPKPIHIRVQAPATLPNDLKMQLAGCFVIANTWGNLASERIEAETVSLNCMTHDRKTMITGEIKGYLADQGDGARDLRGRVVTKMGALMGRAIVTDTLGGMGESIGQNAGTTSISALGSVQDLDGRETVTQGLASGVGGGFSRAADYLGELIAQSGPVIESGGARDVMIMIQDVATLEIINLETEQLNPIGG